MMYESKFQGVAFSFQDRGSLESHQKFRKMNLVLTVRAIEKTIHGISIGKDLMRSPNDRVNVDLVEM